MEEENWLEDHRKSWLLWTIIGMVFIYMFISDLLDPPKTKYYISRWCGPTGCGPFFEENNSLDLVLFDIISPFIGLFGLILGIDGFRKRWQVKRSKWVSDYGSQRR